jgi:predicted kinase
MQPKVILVCGLPCTGKSTVSKVLAKKIRQAGKKSVILRTDEIRKKLIEKPQYTEDEKKFVYNVLLMFTEFFLKKDINCIVDGTFYRKSLRNTLKEVAEKNNAGFLIIECTLDEKKVEKSIGSRKKGLSDADFEVYKKIKKQWEPIKEKHIVFDTDWSTFNRKIKNIQRFLV